MIKNDVFIAIVLSGASSQILKILIQTIKNKRRFHWKDLFTTGNMPSVHTALVTSLAFSIYLNENFSNLFWAVLVFSIIVVVDAMGVRRTAGEEGKTINRLIKASRLKVKAVHYAIGHTPLQVLAGAAIGILSAYISFI